MSCARRVWREADELILRRTNSRDGRKTAYINDRRASGEVLRALSDCLVELHGQQDDRGLLNPRGHRALLDAFADAAPLLDATRAAWRALGAARKRMAAAQTALDDVKAEEEFLRHAVTELDALDPKPGEEAELDQSRRLMQAAERIGDDIAKAHAALGYEGAEGALGNALRWLEGVADRAEGQLDGPIAAIGRALNELGEAEQGVAACIDALSFNPADLERVEERLFAIRALARKHGVNPDDLGDFAETLRAKLAALEGGAADLEKLGAAVRAAEAAYANAADRADRGAARGGGPTGYRHGRRTRATEDGARGVFDRDNRRRPRTGGSRHRRVHGCHQPRRARRTAEQDRLGRRAEPVFAGAEGLSDRRDARDHDDLRRDRPWRRRARPPTRWGAVWQRWRRTRRCLS